MAEGKESMSEHHLSPPKCSHLTKFQLFIWLYVAQLL